MKFWQLSTKNDFQQSQNLSTDKCLQPVIDHLRDVIGYDRFYRYQVFNGHTPISGTGKTDVKYAIKQNYANSTVAINIKTAAYT